MQETEAMWVRSLSWEDPLEKEMATHSSTLAWTILWTEEPGGLKSTGSQRVWHNWAHNQAGAPANRYIKCKQLIRKSPWVLEQSITSHRTPGVSDQELHSLLGSYRQTHTLSWKGHRLAAPSPASPPTAPPLFPMLEKPLKALLLSHDERVFSTY